MYITREILGQSGFLCWILAIFGQLFKERKDKDFFGCSPLLLIRPGASQVQFFFFGFGNEPIWLAHHSKNETMDAPQNRRFYFEI
jgi:hypothetical protein